MTNEVLENIKNRRSIRSYKNNPVPEDLLNLVLEAGSYAPSGMGRQSPTIIAIKDKKYRDIISKLNAKVMNRDADPYYGAPIIILVLADSTISTYVEDGTCALENMMLAASSLGLGTVWVHREKEIFDSKEGKALLKEWNLPETLKGVGSIALGYSNEPIKEAKKRKDNYIVKI